MKLAARTHAGVRSFLAGFVVAVGLLAGSRAAATQDAAAPSFDALARGRELTSQFLDRRLEPVHAAFEARMAQLFKIPDLEKLRADVEQQMGVELRVLDERVTTRDSLQVYVRLARFAKAPLTIEVQWAFDPGGRVAGFFVRPSQSAAPSDFLEYRTRTPLRLPFQGEWFVFWGGRAPRENHHATAPDQRFACDLLMLRDGASHTGDGTTNEQYHAFGQPILAPGAGTVVAAVDGVADNVPHAMDVTQPLGNHVILDHGNGEFSFLAHLRQGSLRVKLGQKVKAGEVLGLCGNSGHSSEPHLHYHLQTSAEPFAGKGLPAQFEGYVADGLKVERGEPKQGQKISVP